MEKKAKASAASDPVNMSNNEDSRAQPEQERHGRKEWKEEGRRRRAEEEGRTQQPPLSTSLERMGAFSVPGAFAIHPGTRQDDASLSYWEAEIPSPPPRAENLYLVTADRVSSMVVEASPVFEDTHENNGESADESRRSGKFWWWTVALVVLVLIAIVVALGVSLGMTSGSDNGGQAPSSPSSSSSSSSWENRPVAEPLPSPSPSASPSARVIATNTPSSAPKSLRPSPTTSAPTTSAERCPDELSAFSSCVSSGAGSLDSCASCIVDYLSALETCAQLEYYTCGAMEACPDCGDCGNAYETLSNCVNKGNCDPLFCPTPSPSVQAPSSVSPPSPVAAPSSSEPCTEEQAAFDSCVATTGLGATACNSCILEYVPNIGLTCAQSEVYTCDTMEACPECGDCESVLESWINCRNEGRCDPFTCPTPLPPVSSPVQAPSPASAPSPSEPCPDERSVLTSCVANGTSSEGTIDSCLSCLSDYLPDNVITCEQSESYTCGAKEACPECGDCESEYETFVNCLNEGRCDPFSCNTTSTPVNPPA